jgi:hypothetical protein
LLTLRVTTRSLASVSRHSLALLVRGSCVLRAYPRTELLTIRLRTESDISLILCQHGGVSNGEKSGSGARGVSPMNCGSGLSRSCHAIERVPTVVARAVI